MEAKYPQADFAAYFAFLNRCARRRQAGHLHKHHIAPRALFPKLACDLANLMPLTVANHEKAHQILNAVNPSDFRYYYGLEGARRAGYIGRQRSNESSKWLAAT